MPARIRITKGPDQGAETVLTTGEVRIGRGAGCQFVVTDEMFNGQLRVYFQGATYWVSNETDSKAYVIALNPLSRKYEATDFPPGSKRVWDHEYQIQPTANTVLTLSVEEAPEGSADEDDDGDGDVVVTRTKTPAEEKRARDRLYLIVAALCAPLALLLFLQPSADSGPPTETRSQVSKRFDRVSEDLAKWKSHPKHGRSAAMVDGLIRDARLDEVSDRPASASDAYQRARDELDRALGDRPSDDRRTDPDAFPADTVDPAEKSFRSAREFASDRLVVLGRANPTRTR